MPSGRNEGVIMNKICSSPEALQDLLPILANFFIYPEEEFCEEVYQGKVDLLVEELSQKAGVPVKSSLKEIAPTYEAWIASYNHCFLGVEKPFAPPVESVYKAWTEDETFQVPFKNQKGYLMGDSALHVQHILDAFGLDIPPEYNMMPDHLVILLDLLAFLIGNSLEEEARQLIKDHFDWLPDLQATISKLPVNGEIYIEVLDMLINVLNGFIVNTASYNLRD